MMAAILIICGSIVLLTACSENDDPVSGNESGDGSVDASGQVVMMYYGVGGENLDPDTEEALAAFAAQQMSGTGVRSFVQFKYSAERNYRWSENYEPSGDYGCVYRFEMNKNSVNSDYNSDVAKSKVFAGSGFKKFAGSDFKMYDPQNLADFINYCMQQAPNAKAYVLAFGDHGGAYNITTDYNKSLVTRGVMYDDNLSGNPCMTPTEIAAALDKLSRKPDMIYFDCCIMSNLEVLGELQGRTKFVFASGHSVRQMPLNELCKSLMGVAKSSNVDEGIRTYMGDYVNTITTYMRNRYKYYSGNRIERSMDYTLTDMSELPALFASIKAVVDFLEKTDISDMDVDLFNDAASGCYQYVDNRPLFDVMGYLNQLKEKPFKGNSEFAALVSQVETAVKACHIAHDEFSYDTSGTDKRYDLSYSVTLGFSSSRLIFSTTDKDVKAHTPTTPQGVIMYCVKAGRGTTESPFYNDYQLENGDNFLSQWIEGQEYNFRNVTCYWEKGSGTQFSWDNSYRTLQFDKATGWSNWMKKNPGIHDDNPPYDDQYNFDYPDPDFYDIVGSK